MAYRILQEQPTHFVVHNGQGSIRIAKGPLSPKMIDKIRRVHAGDEVIHAAEGVEVPDIPPAQYANPEAQANPPSVARTFAAEDARQKALNTPQSVGDFWSKALESIQDPEYVAQKHLAEAAAHEASQGVPDLLARPPEEAAPTPQPIQGQPFAPLREAPIPGMADLNRGIKEQKAGIQASADVAGNVAAANVGIQDYYLKQSEAAKQAYDAQMKGNDDRIRAMQSDILTNKIDPNHFWETRSTGQKVTAAIGMLLSGAGSAVAGQPNYAMKVIDESINRDIDAQKANLQTKQNLLRTYMEQGHSYQQAYALTKAHLLEVTAAQTIRAANQYGGQAAQAQAQQAAGQLDQQAVGLRAQVTANFYQTQNAKAELAMRQASMAAMGQLMGAPQGGTSTTAGQPTTGGLRGGAHLDPRVVPYLSKEARESLVQLDDGTFAQAFTSDDAKAMKDLQEETRDFQHNLSEYRQLFNKHPHGVSKVMSPEDYGKAKSLHAALIAGGGKIAKLQRFTEAESEHIYQPMTPDITDVNALSQAPAGALDTLQGAVNSRNLSAARTRLVTRLPGMF